MFKVPCYICKRIEICKYCSKHGVFVGKNMMKLNIQYEKRHAIQIKNLGTTFNHEHKCNFIRNYTYNKIDMEAMRG